MPQFANPLYYPSAILVGGITLVLGVRFINLSNKIILPTSIAATVLTVAALKTIEPDENQQSKQQLEQEIQSLKIASDGVVQQANELRQEANQLLTQNSYQIDLLVAIQQACDRVSELPDKINKIAKNLPQKKALLSVEKLEKELLEVQHKLRSSTGISRQRLQDLAISLKQNIKLAKTGQDTRQAKLISLEKMIQDSAGILQLLQNQLRTADLTHSEDIQELRSLSEELKAYQENVDILTQ
ncbi:MAG: hypothetical protein WBA77_18380 [Microcoleaceae cyanobacterium]